MKCPVCATETTAEALFCPTCGGKLPAAGNGIGKSASSDSATASSNNATASGAKQAASGEQSAPSGAPGGRGRTSDIPEETLWEGTFSPKAMIGTYVGCAVLSVALVAIAFAYAEGILRMILLGAIVVLWIAAFVRLVVQRLGVSYKLTNQMFYHRKGVLTRTTDRIELIEIHDVTWRQGLVERMVNVGTIIITSSDRTHHLLLLPGIDNVEEVARQIDKARRGEQVRRGRRIESIGVQDA